MPNLSITRQDIEVHIETNVSGIIDISYDNVPFETEGKSEYAHFAIHFQNSSNVNTGATLFKRIRHIGVIIFKLYTPIDSGTANVFTLLDNIKTQVENKYISSNLITYAAEPAREGVGREGYYTYFLRIPFVSDEC